MAIVSLTGAQVQLAVAWTGTAPGGSTVPSGTLSSPSDISSWVTNVSVDDSLDLQDITNFGSAGYKQQASALRQLKFTFSALNDYAASQLDQIIYTTIGGLTTLVYVDVKPTSSARGTANPSWVFATYLSDWQPLSAKVGDVPQVSVTWTSTGRYARLTA